MYRICTEDKNRETIYQILDSHVDGYAVMPGIGSWRGVREASLTIDLIGPTAETVRVIAEQIRQANDQEAVLVLNIHAEEEFIFAPLKAA